MTHVTKDIERPLGRDIRPPARKNFLPSARALAIGIAATALFVTSGLIAFREKPFRNPALSVTPAEQLAETKPLPETPTETAAKSPPAERKGGASIIKVNPENASGRNSVIVIRDPSALGQDLRVAHLPDRALIEESASGPLPIRSADGRRPVDIYARPWSGARGARVAIVIGGLAVSQTGTQAAIQKLPPEVTLAFAAQGNSIGRWMQAARRKGHEILMQVPLEPFDYPNVDPGRNTLTVDASADENIERLRWTLSRTTNYVGVMNYMGARYVADAQAMEPVMAEFGKRGLLFLDDGSTARSVAADLAARDRVPFASGDAIVDAERDRGAILKKLDQLEATARAKGFALGTGSAFDITIDTVTSWVAEAKKRGVEIVPVSAIAIDPEKG